MVAGLLGAVLVGAATTLVSPGPAVAATAAGTVTILLLRRPALIVPAAIVSSFAVTPAFLPSQIDVSGVTVFPYEPFVAAASLWTWSRARSDGRMARRLLVLSVVTVAGVMHGFQTGVPEKALGEGRALLTFVGFAFIASHVAGTPEQVRSLRAICGVLWWSAGLTVLASATGLRLAGRADEVGLGLTSGFAAATGATRYITNATHLAIVVACGCVGLLAAGRSSVSRAAGLLVPSLTVLGLSFSRNHLIGLLAAGLFGVVAIPSIRHASRTIARAAAAGLVVVVLIVAAPQLRGLPGLGFVAVQLDAYSERVVAGLSTDVRSQDYSVRYRADETKALVASISERPLEGHGLGYPYRPLQARYVDDALRFYGHNLYLWLTVKIGLIGLAIFLWVALVPALSWWRSQGDRGLTAAAAVIGILAVAIVAPPPFTTIGAAVGLLSRPAVLRQRASGRAVAPDPDRSSAARP